MFKKMKLSNNSIKLKSQIIEKKFSDIERFKREKYFYYKFKKKNLAVPKLIKVSKNKIYFKRYNFKKIKSQKLFFSNLLNFLKKTNKIKNYNIYAKENLISYNSLYNQVKRRFNKIENLSFEKKYLKRINSVKTYIKEILDEKHKSIELSKVKLIISQSDIGFHNCGIINKKIFFYDFEYCGLDHPIKLICDVYYQPEKKINKKFMLKFIKDLEKNFKFKLPSNFILFEKLLKAKMMLIILNIFVFSNINNISKSLNKIKLEKIKLQRLKKALNYINIPFIYD
jgi:hypothetical protein